MNIYIEKQIDQSHIGFSGNIRRLFIARFPAWIATLAYALAGISIVAISPTYAQDIDREELQRGGDRSIEFQNYPGPHDRIDTVDAILNIGRTIGAGEIEPGERSVFGGYSIVRAVDPDATEKLNADIFILNSGAKVDHIDNIRRIITGYLESAYSYSQDDAILLAKLITVYNAFYNKNIDFFSETYNQIVLDNINPDQVGLSTLYSDWPGNTEIVIPLSVGASPGSLDIVDPLQLTDDPVIETLREQDDRGIEERRAAVDLIERTIDERQDRLDTLDAERARQAQELEEAQRTQRTTDDLTPEEQRRLDEQARQAELAAREERDRVAQLTDSVREQREDIAADTQELLDGRDSRTRNFVLFPIVRQFDGRVQAHMARIDAETGEVLRQSNIETISNRTYIELNNDLLVLASQNGFYRLLVLDDETLRPLRSGEVEIFPESIVLLERNSIYAIFKAGARWRLGRFNANLRMLAQSSIDVEPYTSMLFDGNLLYLQQSNGTIVRVDRQRLNTIE